MSHINTWLKENLNKIEKDLFVSGVAVIFAKKGESVKLINPSEVSFKNENDKLAACKELLHRVYRDTGFFDFEDNEFYEAVEALFPELFPKMKLVPVVVDNG